MSEKNETAGTDAVANPVEDIVMQDGSHGSRDPAVCPICKMEKSYEEMVETHGLCCRDCDTEENA